MENKALTTYLVDIDNALFMFMFYKLTCGWRTRWIIYPCPVVLRAVTSSRWIMGAYNLGAWLEINSISKPLRNKHKNSKEQH